MFDDIKKHLIESLKENQALSAHFALTLFLTFLALQRCVPFDPIKRSAILVSASQPRMSSSLVVDITAPFWSTLPAH